MAKNVRPEPVPYNLQAMSEARRYQAWIMQALKPWIGRRILEVGAGTGTMSRHLAFAQRLLLMEPDPVLRSQLRRTTRPWASRGQVRILNGGLPLRSAAGLVKERLDTVLSINVLEHVRDDAAALRGLADLLRRGKQKGRRSLVTFVPAHAWAFGTLDRADGHFRRYDAASVRRLAAKAAPEAVLHIEPFNFFGLWGWWLNGRVLKRPKVDDAAITAFDRLLPFLGPLDWAALKLLRLPWGQSLIFTLTWD